MPPQAWRSPSLSPPGCSVSPSSAGRGPGSRARLMRRRTRCSARLWTRPTAAAWAARCGGAVGAAPRHSVASAVAQQHSTHSTVWRLLLRQPFAGGADPRCRPCTPHRPTGWRARWRRAACSSSAPLGGARAATCCAWVGGAAAAGLPPRASPAAAVVPTRSFPRTGAGTQLLHLIVALARAKPRAVRTLLSSDPDWTPCPLPRPQAMP